MIWHAYGGINSKGKLLFYPVFTLRNDLHKLLFLVFYNIYIYRILSESKAFLAYESLQ